MQKKPDAVLSKNNKLQRFKNMEDSVYQSSSLEHSKNVLIAMFGLADQLVKEYDLMPEEEEYIKNTKEQMIQYYQEIIRRIVEIEKEESIQLINEENNKNNKIIIFYEFVEKVVELNKGVYDEITQDYIVDMISEVSKAAGVDNEKNGRKSDIEMNLISLGEQDLIDSIDKMEGPQFENFCAEVLKGNGFVNVEVTKTSGDQGIDILSEKDGIKYAIQCKRYSTDLSNTPVQEVCAGKKYYKAHLAVVLTNSYFTRSAEELANETGVILWNREKLFEMVKKWKNS